MSSSNTELATVGGGCFWCVEAVYERIDGVKTVTSGYAGGEVDSPTYEQVCTGTTGHAEVVQIEFDPKTVSYRSILNTFFTAHDPTTKDRQGADVGPQYRSIILAHSDEQRAEAERARSEVQELLDATVVTEITAIDRFYPAETYHQDYFRNNPNAGYCRVVIQPKLSKLGML